MSTRYLGVLVSALAAGAIAMIACGSDGGNSGFEDGTYSSGGGSDDAAAGSSSGFGGSDAKSPTPCTGLQCQQVACGGGSETTVTGTVFAPNGKLPLYNAIVYVPNAPVKPLPKGVQCDKCGAVSGDPVVSAISGPDGKFTLKNVPVGKGIPLVIQIGKWRRQVTLPEVKQCQDNAVVDPELTRLPKNQSEGNMPHIALTTGGCDNLGCMLPKVGIDPAEFGKEADGDAKAVHVFKGGSYIGSGDVADGPTGAPGASSFWNDVNRMKNYDLLVLSCECSESPTTKAAPAYAAMTEYLKAGGRIFTTDFMYTWYKFSPDPQLKSIGTIPGGAPGGANPMDLDKSFPKGQALNDWLQVAFPTATPGKVQADYVFDNISALDATKTQKWAASGPPNHPRVFTVNLPVELPADQQCGKGVHIDAHVNQPTLGSTDPTKDAVNASYPNSCPTPLKPAEGMFAFFFFDLASCIQKDNQPPAPPPVVK